MGGAAVRPETKYVDGYLDSTAVHVLSNNDDTWADCELNPRQQASVYGCLPVPRQGTNCSDRDGRKIFVKNIKIRGRLQFTGADTVTTNQVQGFVRLIVVKDTTTCNATLSAENVIGPGLGSDGAAALTGDSAIMSMTDPDGWGRYKILADRIYKIAPQSTFSDGTDGTMNDYYMPFKITVKVNCYINFSGSTGVIGDVVDNSIHLIGASSTSTNGVNISYVARTAFIG